MSAINAILTMLNLAILNNIHKQDTHNNKDIHKQVIHKEDIHNKDNLNLLMNIL